MITDRISAVLPLRVVGCRDGKDGERAQILISSISSFAEDDLFHKIYVMVPDVEYDCLRESFNGLCNLPIEVLSETEVEPSLALYSKINGWAIQQILKLAISNLIQTSYYLTLDADVIACKPITKERLFVDGKGILQTDAKVEPKTYFNRAWWWKTSARILNVADKSDEAGIAVSPALLSTKVCRMLLAELSKITPATSSWTEALLTRKDPGSSPNNSGRYLNWSEYSLYYLFLQKSHLTNVYHHLQNYDDDGFVMLSLNSFGFSKSVPDIKELDFDAFFSENDKALFFVIQSDRQIDPEIIRQATKKYFKTSCFDPH